MTGRYRFLAFLPLLLLLPHSVRGQGVRGQGTSDWQQHVHYEMDVTLLADRHRMDGRQRLTYVNNSPDTLTRVFYHLYFNAFQPRSMMAERNRHLPDPDPRIVPRIFNLGPDEIGFHRIESLRQNGTPLEFSIYDTVMEVELADPIPPGGQALFEMAFHSQIPLQTRRSGRDNAEGIDYSMSQWYPKVANYDERGWHADPYVGREFYAPFGTFDVRMTLPAAYVVGSTGVLQNPDEIGHGYAEDSVAVDADSLTWHFRAQNVHDFAWAADPDYVHDVLQTEEGTTIHLLYQPSVADTWQRLHDWAPQIMSFFGREYGRYLYPQMTVAQAGDGGMEYPMITLITGERSPTSLLGVTAHEVAHMWFYGMMGSNESDYAWMDEGFASYATAEVIAHVRGSAEATHLPAYLAVLQAKHLGLFEPLNTPSDWFHTNYAYSRAAYSGGEMLLEMLGYVISDSLRDRFLHEYHDRFAFRHPNPYSVEKIAEDVSGIRLDWYFEQFGNRTWELDYELRRLRSRRSDAGWETTITVEREARAVMPVDVRLTLDDGTVQWVHVPLSIMQGHKPVPANWIVGEPWGWTSTVYTVDLTLPARVVAAEIDPRLLTPESTRLNNTADLPLDFTFLHPPNPGWRRYHVGWRPLAVYAHQWGFGGGVQFRGAYLFDQHAAKAAFTVWPEVVVSGGEDPAPNAGGLPASAAAQRSVVDGVDFDLSLSNTSSPGPLLTWILRSRKHLGILQNDAQLSLLLDPADLLETRHRRVTAGLRHQHRTTDRSDYNHVSEGFFPQAMLSAHARIAVTGELYRYVVSGETGGSLDSRSETGTANRVSVDLAWGVPLGPFTGSVRLAAGVGDRELARHKRFRLGSVPLEDRWSDAAYRTLGAAFENPLETLHWAAFGGVGPVAYLRRTPALRDAESGAFAGSHAAAASARLLMPRLRGARLLRPLRFELFVGGGETWNGGWWSNFKAGDVLADAGLGLRYDLEHLTGFNRWIDQSDVLSNLTLTATFPLWASHPERTDDTDSFAFRWILGVQLDEISWH